MKWVVLVIGACSIVAGCDSADAEKERRFAAFGKCQVALMAASRSLDKVEVDFIDPVVTQERYRFAWRLAQGVRTSENFGLPSDADCHVDRETGKIVLLQVRGRSLAP